MCGNDWRRWLMIRGSWALYALVFFFVVSVFAGSPATAMSSDEAETYRAGLEAIQEANDPERAMELLQELVATDPLFELEKQGSAVFWLAEAYEKAGHERQAFIMRRMGARALLENEAIDWWLVDGYVRDVFRNQRHDEYVVASELYMRALAAIPAGGPDELLGIVRTHIAASAVVLSEAEREETRTARPTAEAMDEGWQAPEVLTEYLQRWWRRADPDLVTPRNERLEEHLERLAIAWRDYRTEGELDDRGFIFVRLGEPQFKSEVPFDSRQFRDRVINEIPGVSSFDFRDNEIWSFRHVDRNATYLFAEKEGRYYDSEVMELLPRRLQRGFSTSARGTRDAEGLVYALYEVYQSLSNYQVEYGTRFMDIANFAHDLDMRRLYDTNIDISPERPSTVASRETSRARTEDKWFAEQRERTVPDSRSFVHEDLESWPFEVRTARFLTEEGETRTEVYWALDARGMQEEEFRVERLGLELTDVPAERLLQSVIAQRDGDYVLQADSEELYKAVLNNQAPDQENWVKGSTSFTNEVEDPNEPFHLALQWNGHILLDEPEDGPLTGDAAGPLTSITRHTVDSLYALNGDTGTFEMSDLKPVRLTNGLADLDAAQPYPFHTLQDGSELGLYFELYHLAMPDEEPAQYTIEYEILRHRQRGLLARTFTADIPDRTVTTLEQESDTSRTDELIMIDWKEEWDEGTVQVNVRVTDEWTGEVIQRSISFAVGDE